MSDDTYKELAQRMCGSARIHLYTNGKRHYQTGELIRRVCVEQGSACHYPIRYDDGRIAWDYAQSPSPTIRRAVAQFFNHHFGKID